jgi:hypothetical protein
MTISPSNYPDLIRESGLSIYDSIDPTSSPCWIPTPALEQILNMNLSGHSLNGLALRSRSKRMKELVCLSLGYPVPPIFKKTRPRFLGQNFDTYGMKANNLQVWNEELFPDRRYVLVRIGENGIIERVKVVTGDVLQRLDKTGKLTRKHQARFTPQSHPVTLLSTQEDRHIRRLYGSKLTDPSSYQLSGALLPIQDVAQRLSSLVSSRFKDAGVDQERNRGAMLHELVCKALGYSTVRDRGQIPDITQQLLEVKLQTSPTIDLGLISPDSTAPLPDYFPLSYSVRFCDIRYAIFGANIIQNELQIETISLVRGYEFYQHFPRFGGLKVNQKIQIPLPANFF